MRFFSFFFLVNTVVTSASSKQSVVDCSNCQDCLECIESVKFSHLSRQNTLEKPSSEIVLSNQFQEELIPENNQGHYSKQWFALNPLTSSFRGLSEPIGAFVDLKSYFHHVASDIRDPPLSNFPWFNDTFPSDVADGGFAKWQEVHVSDSNGFQLSLQSSLVNQQLLTDFYGIMGIEHKTYFVGKVYIPKTGTYHFEQVFTPKWLWVDGKKWITESGATVGKWNGASRLLKLGWHTMVIATMSYGAGVEVVNLPTLILHETRYNFVDNDILIPQVLENQVTGNFFSPVFESRVDLPEGLKFKTTLKAILNSKVIYETSTKCRHLYPIYANVPVPLTIPIPNRQRHGKEYDLDLETLKELNQQATDELWPRGDELAEVWLYLKVKLKGNVILDKSYNFTVTKWDDTHGWNMIFLDDDGTLDSAGIVSPRNFGRHPVIITMHGAGVSATSPVWTGSYSRQANSWIYFPMNRREYGWNWEGKGARGIWTGLEFLKSQAERGGLGLHNLEIDLRRLYYTGHSMGGHGTLVLASSHPDYAIGYSPCSGWLTQTLYLPSHLSTDYFTMSYQERGIWENNAGGLGEIGTRLENTLGLYGLARMGTLDDVVPSWNLRRWYRNVKSFERLYNLPSRFHLDEVPERGHWWGEVVGDDVMQKWFDLLNSTVPELPRKFVLQTSQLTSMGTRGGFRILQNFDTGKVSRLEVFRDGNVWHVKTVNVRRFQWIKHLGLIVPDRLKIGKQEFKVKSGDAFLCKCCGGNVWETCQGQEWKREKMNWMERGPDSYGPMSIIQERPLVIFTSKKYHGEVFNVVMEMYTRTRSALVVDSVENRDRYKGWNMMFVEESKLVRTWVKDSPIQLEKDGFRIKRAWGTEEHVSKLDGCLYLMPLKPFGYDKEGKHLNHQLGLVVTGNSRKAVSSAIAHLPLFAASRVPDWVIVKASQQDFDPIGWRGMGGSQAGYFDWRWRVV